MRGSCLSFHLSANGPRYVGIDSWDEAKNRCSAILRRLGSNNLRAGRVFNLGKVDLMYLGGLIHISGLKFTAAFDLYVGPNRIALSDLTKD